MPPKVEGLTVRQRQVLARLLRGDAELEIGEALNLASGTVHKYVHQVYRHFGAVTRARLMAMWIVVPANGRFDWEPFDA